MVEFRRINTTLVVILLLQFTAVTGKTSLSLTVRAGHSVTLLCENVIKPQHKCDSTIWLYSRHGETFIELINLGQMGRNGISKAKADRLSVTENCYLVVHNITPEDAGRYTCRQFRSGGKQQGPDFQVLLSVIDMTFASHLDQKSLKCNVRVTKTGETLLCDAGPQSSCQKTGSTPAGRNDPPGQDWLRFIIVSVGLASLIITVVTVTIWTRAKGNRAQTDDNAVHNDEDEGVVTYENVGEPSASIRLH
ncbi:uncharacterized protein LOC117477206 [Trematomus bernacchii]|uniref:uncharacterized protein LOC117477206 n=1 Tax=Trematomus bernacchii TaxID=40690 RepID=UPI00146CBFEC|nr:uncharacterized protein LOC117477206 [Trematomus bernacchii]